MDLNGFKAKWPSMVLRQNGLQWFLRQNGPQWFWGKMDLNGVKAKWTLWFVNKTAESPTNILRPDCYVKYDFKWGFGGLAPNQNVNFLLIWLDKVNIWNDASPNIAECYSYSYFVSVWWGILQLGRFVKAK